MRKFLKISIKTLRWAVIILMCAIILLFSVIMISGIKLYIVLDPSMDPDYPLGSLIYVEEVDVDTLQAGDVITFKLSGNTVATHRITETILNPETGERVFGTKGDLSEESDPGLLTEDGVIGVPTYVIPEIGYFIADIKYPPGSYICITVGILLMVFVFFSDNLIALIDKKEKTPKSDR